MFNVHHIDDTTISITEHIFARVMSEYRKAEDEAFIKAIREWAKEEKEYYRIMEIPEDQLKLILKLGLAEYERRQTDDQT